MRNTLGKRIYTCFLSQISLIISEIMVETNLTIFLILLQSFLRNAGVLRLAIQFVLHHKKRLSIKIKIFIR